MIRAYPPIDWRCIMNNDLTVPEIINDPMIRILNNADRISERAFAQLMESAARVAQRSTGVLAGSYLKRPPSPLTATSEPL